jgi:hypothetical protein
MTRENRDIKIEENRPKRVKLHERKRNVLTINKKDPNYHYRIVNDTPGRVEELKAWGYEVVTDTGINVGENEGNTSLGTGARTHVGSGMQAILMRTRKEFYEEDQKAKQDAISSKEALMKKKPVKSTESGEDGTYGEVSISK